MSKQPGPEFGDGEVDPHNPASVLFLCNLNAIRSPMAEALLKLRFGRKIFAQSAGIRVGNTDPFAITVMKELGVDLSNHRPKALQDLEDTWFDLIVTLSPAAHLEAVNMDHVEASKVLFWPMDDPSSDQGSREQMLDAFRRLRDTIDQKLQRQFTI